MNALPPPIHFRSYFSLLDGIFSPEDLCALAAASGAEFVGMADINNFYGLPAFLRAASGAGLSPLVGFEARRKGRHLFTAYAHSREGFARANGIVSRLTAAEKPGPCWAPGGEAGNPSPAGRPSCGPIPGFSGAASGNYDPLSDLLLGGWKGLSIVVPDPKVIEILAAAGTAGLCYGLVWGNPFRDAGAVADRFGVPAIILNRAVYATEGHKRFLSLVRSIRRILPLDKLPPEEIPGREEQYVPPLEAARYFSALPEAAENTLRFARENTYNPFSGVSVFPRFRDFTEEQAFSRLRELCHAGISRRYGSAPRPEVFSRLSSELSIISAKGFAGYFLVVHDIVSRFPRTCGRGSSAASIVSYLLGITHVEPLSSDLFFERFLNLGRKDPPDIDVDFPWDERRAALEYVFSAYPGASAMVADHVTFGPRSCMREAAKALGFPDPETDRYVRLYRRGDHAPIPAALLKAAKLLRGIPRHIGTHPGGVVITPGPITDFVPVQESPLGLPVIAWEKDGTEDSGLVKIDLLGNRSLGVLRDSLELVNRRIKKEPPKWDTSVVPAREHLAWESFCPLNDKGTRNLIEKGDTLGVFYVESPATRQLLRKMGVGDYPHLVVASSIIRPAANRSIEEYVRRLRGGAWEPIHPDVEKVLAETLGIMVYQEDVSRIALEVCGFSPEDADTLRKVLTRKDRHVRLGVYKDRFFQGGRTRGLTDKALDSLWEQVLSFDGYSFCKAHSASYALVSYRLAWIKRYFPLEFFACVINNGGGFYTRQVYLNALRRMGFPIFGPDVNRSSWEYLPEGEGLRVGLSQLSDIAEPFLRRLLSEREKSGPFRGLPDFFHRLSPRLPEFRVLVRSGALDSSAYPLTRPQMFWAYAGRSGPPSLFGPPPAPAWVGDYAPATKARDEIRTTGLSITRHPLSYFGARAAEAGRCLGVSVYSSRQIKGNLGKRVHVPGMLVTGKEVPTRKKESMSFLTFEDPFGLFETVVFPGVYGRILPVLDENLFFLVSGKVTEEQGAVQIVVDNLLPLRK